MRNHTNMCVYWSKEIESNESENYHNTKFEAFVEAGCSFSIIRAYYDHQHHQYEERRSSISSFFLCILVQIAHGTAAATTQFLQVLPSFFMAQQVIKVQRVQSRHRRKKISQDVLFDIWTIASQGIAPFVIILKTVFIPSTILCISKLMPILHGLQVYFINIISQGL